MKTVLTIIAGSALALGAAACSKPADNSANVSSEDNMLVPADENGMGSADMNAAGADNAMAGDNMMGGDNMMSDNSMATGNSTNAM